MDGQLLARARAEKENIRRRALAEEDRRRTIAYGKVPVLRDMERRLAALVGEVVASVSGNGRPVEEIRKESLELQAERAEILVANGWSMDWLDTPWECPKCRDTGYVEGRMCACLKALYETERKKDLSALLKLGSESFENFDLSYYEGGDRKHMETVLNICKKYVAPFGENSMNLLFRGEPGLGKTFLSACIAREVSRQGFSVVYETVVDALGAFESRKFRGGEGDADAKVERMLSCDLLILDDLGTEMITEFTKSALYTIVNTRLLRSKKTIISTNLTPDEMEHQYTSQIASRLRGDYQEVLFKGRDIRLQRKERGLR